MEFISTASRLRESVAEEVRALLARRRLTGAKLAADIGRSEMYVSRRLRGETAFDLDDLERIAEVLGIDAADLVPRRTGDNPRNLGRSVRSMSRRPTRPNRPTHARTTRPSGRPTGAAGTAPSATRPQFVRPDTLAA